MIYTINDILTEAKNSKLVLDDTGGDYKDGLVEKVLSMEYYLENKLDSLPSKPSKNQLLEKGCLIGALRIIGTQDAYSCPRSTLKWLNSI
jgi:hypothetical protein